MKGPFRLQVDLSSAGALQVPNSDTILFVDGIESMDTMYYRWTGDAVSTGEVAARLRCSPDEADGGEVNTLTLDGAINSLDVKGAAALDFNVTTTEAGVSGELNLFIRRDS